MRFHVDFIRIKYATHVLTQNYEFSATIWAEYLPFVVQIIYTHTHTYVRIFNNGN